MTVLHIITALIRIAGRLIEWAQRRQLLNLGRAQAIAEEAERLRDIAERARAIEEEVTGMDKEELRRYLDGMYRD